MNRQHKRCVAFIDCVKRIMLPFLSCWRRLQKLALPQEPEEADVEIQKKTVASRKSKLRRDRVWRRVE